MPPHAAKRARQLLPNREALVLRRPERLGIRSDAVWPVHRRDAWDPAPTGREHIGELVDSQRIPKRDPGGEVTVLCLSGVHPRRASPDQAPAFRARASAGVASTVGISAGMECRARSHAAQTGRCQWLRAQLPRRARRKPCIAAEVVGWSMKPVSTSRSRPGSTSTSLAAPGS